MQAVYIGDEVAGAGFALAGLTVLTPPPGAEAAALEAARSHRGTELVLVSAAAAKAIPAALLDPALAAMAPITVLVPDLVGATPWPDPSARLRRQLGVEP